MVGNTNFGWQLFGTLLCGFIFALPVVLGFYIYKFTKDRLENRKIKKEKEQTVV